MTGIQAYSTTAASNVQANTGINWDEGMPPGSVNNSARQNMADSRAAFNDLIWFQYGTGDTSTLSTSVVYSSSTAFKVKGVDVTTPYHAGRRVKAVGTSTGTIYGTISSSSFSTDTTVNVTWDSGSLSNETITVYLSQVPVTGSPINSSAISGNQTGTWTPTDTSGASLSFTGVSAAYTKIGNMVYAYFRLTYPATANGSNSQIGGLPFTVASATYAIQGLLSLTTTSNINEIVASNNTTNFQPALNASRVTNANLTGAILGGMVIYPVT